MIAVFALLVALAFAVCVAILTANVVLVGIAVALDAIVVVADAFFDVLAPNLFLRVLVAAVAGVATVVVAHMAGHTAIVVVAIELEILGVVEGRRRPLVLAVALATVAGDLLVQRILGRLVAILAVVARRLLKQAVVEMPGRSEALHPGMIAMTGDAIIIDEFLVEWRRGQRLCNR